MADAGPGPQNYSASDFQRDVNVSRETLQRLDRYVALLISWNRRINLVARSTVPHIWWRHVLDSAQLVDCAPAGARRWLDIGSGAGLPGIVVALLLSGRGDIRVDLVESSGKKCAFLREAVRATGAPARVICSRLESAPADLLAPRYDVVMARAVAPLKELLRLSARMRDEQTVCLFPKGEHVDSELTVVRKHWKLAVETVPSRTSRAASVIVIKEALRCRTG